MMDAVFGSGQQPQQAASAATTGGQDAAASPAEMLDPSMCCMSVVTDGPRIAFCAYREESSTLVLEECYANGYDVHSVVERVLSIIRPTLVLVSAKLVGNAVLMQLLTTPPPQAEADTEQDENGDNENQQQNNDTESNNNNNNNQNATTTNNNNSNRPAAAAARSSIPYQTMKTSSFDVRACHALILQKLRVRSLMKQQQQQQQQRLGGGGRGRHAAAAAAGQPDRHFAQPQQSSFQSYQVSSYHALASVIDFESTLQIQAVGSLLSFLNSTVFRLEQDDGGHIIINDVVRANSSLYMNISSATLSALHVFATEHHPLIAKGAGNSKEGFSLFSLLDRTHSRSGRERLRGYMLKPLVDVDAIRQRQDGVELWTRPEMADFSASLSALLGRVVAVDKILLRIQKCSAQPQHDVVALMRSLMTAIGICDMLQHEVLFFLRQQEQQQARAAQQQHFQEDNDDNDNRFFRYIAFVEGILQNCCIHEGLSELLEQLNAVVDEAATNEWHALVIRKGYNAKLDQLKDQYAQLPEILLQTGRQVEARLGPSFSNMIIQVVFIPQIGFHVRLPDDEAWAAAENSTLPDDFDCIYTEDGYTFFKDDTTRALDLSIGDLDSNIKDTEALIVADLEDNILTYEQELRDTFNSLADLDCILSFACVAIESGYVRPQVVPQSENCIEIINGRHPLQETILENDFIPNDTNISTDTRLSIVTGPNFSGKSCYARQVGVLVYMAHIGAFIPCDAARISVVNQIFARFSTVETCAVPQSSFQLDLSEMGSILRRAGPGSLVLIDEFGKGTSPASGIALLAAALKKLAANQQCKVICTTHFLEVFSMGLLTDGADGVKALNMAVQIPETSQGIAMPLFKLQDGVASSSAGLVCAEMAGVKPAVIERATEIVAAVKERKQVQPLAEILRDNLSLSDLAKDTLSQFIRTDWSKVSDTDLDMFLNKVHHM